jgi:hypothetical protein
MINYRTYTLALLLLSSLLLQAQQTIRIKREDNRFLFYQTGTKSDTITKNLTDLFRIHFPDSIQHRLVIHLRNGQLVKTKNDSLFRLLYIPGMKYSLSKSDTVYIPLLEGICDPSKTISIEVKNIPTRQVLLKNTFIVK